MSQIKNMSPTKLYSCTEIDIYSAETETILEIPLVAGGISAGFPSPAADFIDTAIDLNKHLIKNASATFYGRAKGDSLKDLGINDGDLLVIDKSIKPINGKIAVCFVDGEFTMKVIQIEKDCIWLIPANEKYKPIKVTKDNEFVIWGIVTFTIKKF